MSNNHFDADTCRKSESTEKRCGNCAWFLVSCYASKKFNDINDNWVCDSFYKHKQGVE